MAKSKRKSGSSTDISRWETELAQAPFCEDDWKACVIFAVPKQAEDYSYMRILADTVGTGLRKLFSIIDNEHLIKEVKDLAHGKGKGKVATTKPPQFIEIVDAIKAHADQGEELPPLLLSKLIKFKLLMIKQKDLDRREEEKKALEAAAKQAKQEERSRSKGTSSPGKRSKSQSPGKKKRKDDAPPSPKKDTKLKRRGEVEDTFRTIDDEPDGPDDPKHYIVIHGVYNPGVLQPLIDLGISVNAIVEVKSESYQKIQRRPSKATSEGAEQLVGQDENQEEEKTELQEEDQELLKLKVKLSKFWEESEKIISKAPSGSKIKDIAKSYVVVKDKWVSEGDPQDLEQEKKTEFGTKVFEKVADVCFDLLDYERHYKRYMDNLKLVHIPPLNANTTSPLPGAVSSVSMAEFVASSVQPSKQEKSDTDTRYYNHLMDSIPCESQSVPLILHCLLEQVVVSVEGNDPMDEPPLAREDGLHDLLGKYFDTKLGRFGFKPQTNAKATERTPKTQNSYPTIIYHGDNTTKRLYHLSHMDEINPLSIERTVLKLHPYALMANIPPPNDEERVEVAARKQQLAHFCFKDGYVNGIKQIDRILQHLCFESFMLKHVDESGELFIPEDELSNGHVGWDDPFMDAKVLQKVSLSKVHLGESEKVLEELKNLNDLKPLRNLEEYCYAEYFDPAVLIQVLDQVSTLYPVIDVYYHKGIGALLTVFHNPKDKEYQNNVDWDTWLHSNVGFRNYLEYVADAIDDWQRKQERIAEELANKPVTPQTPPREPSPVPLKTGSRHNMMTRAELTEMKAAEDDKNKKKGRKTRSRSGSPTKRDTNSKGKSPEKRDKTGSSKGRAPSAKPSRSRTGTGSRRSARRRQTHEKQEEESKPTKEQVEIIEPNYPFTGYDIGDDLIHVSGNRSYLFPSDGGLIKLEKATYVHGNVSIRVSVYRDDNYLVMHFINPAERKLDLTADIEISESIDKQPVLQLEEGTEDDTKVISEEDQREKGMKKLLNSLPQIPELNEPTGDYSSFYAQLKDGMSLGMNFSVTKDIKEKCQYLVSEVAQLKTEMAAKSTAMPVASNTHTKAGSPKGRKKHDDDLKKQEELEKQLDAERREKIEELRMEIQELRKMDNARNNLYVTCPDGLHVCFSHTEKINENETVKHLVVRQEYPVRSKGVHPCEKERQKPAMEEKVRCVTADGAVIKYMMDSSVEAFLPDGSILRSPSYSTEQQYQNSQDLSASVNILNISEVSTTQGSSRKKPPSLAPEGQSKKTSSVDVAPEESPEKQGTEWTMIDKNGNRYHIASDGEEDALPDLLLSYAMSPKTSEVVRTREDGLINILRPDGTEIAEHCDGTRITTFYQTINGKLDGETGEETEANKSPVKFVKIECLGYSTVVINSSTREMQTIFGNGTTINALPDGGYDVRPKDYSRLHISSKGEVAFVPREIIESRSTSSTDILNHDVDSLPEGVYSLRHAANDCLFVKDVSGNKFELTSDGDAVVSKGTTNGLDSDSPLARYFVIYQDGSGEELLRHRDISEYLEEAERDPIVAVLVTDEHDQDVKGITVLKPYQESTGEIWLKKKDEDDIIPIELTERDFTTLPPVEIKSDGPVFGSNAGIAFQVATKPLPKPPKKPTTCPGVLEMRHIVKYKPLDNEVRQMMCDGVKAYRDFVTKQMAIKEGLLPVDPRDKVEKEKASQLLQKFQQMTVSDEEEKLESPDKSNIVDAYVQAVTPLPSPPPVKALPKRSKSEWERDKIEMAELKYAQSDLRTRTVPPYFDTEEGQAFLNAVNNMCDMDRIAANLAKETILPPQRPESIASTISDNVGIFADTSGESYDALKQFSSNTPQLQESYSVTSSYADVRAGNSRYSVKNDSLLRLRPTNPTPSQSVAGKHVTNQQQSRPYNPTPGHALKDSFLLTDSDMTISPLHREESRPLHTSTALDSPLQKLIEEDPSQLDIIMNDSSGELYFKDPPSKPKSVDYDVTGRPRNTAVKTPKSISGARPGALPNTKFATTEEPVRRQVKTASVAGAVQPNLTANMRGFKLIPPYVDFGVLQEGLTYSHSFSLKNVGVDSCRFKVKQPPPSTGLRILYKPGPVAAGMSVAVEIEIFAIAVGVEGSSGIGSIRYHLEITTETDILYLPISATILTEHEYENRTEASPKGGPSLHTVVLGQRPASREALTRPRKD